MKKNNFIKLTQPVFNFVFFIFTLSVYAQNPFVTEIYTADPTARVFNDKLYIYPSHDVDVCTGNQGNNGFCMPDYHAFSTDDLFNYTDHGVIVSQNEIPWVKPNSFGMWAPDCIKKNNTYYYYFPAPPRDGSTFRRIGLATSNSPIGPFNYETNYIQGIQGIDPGLFLDTNNNAYLYYALSGEIKVIRLKDNMKEKIGNPINIPLPSGYKEGPFTFERNGIIYLTFPRVGNNGYEIDYATSNSPTGPFTFRGAIMPNIGNGTNHHSIVKYKGKWYLFYHHWSLSGNSTLRSIRVDEITFNNDGSINQKVATIRGVGIPTEEDIIQIDRHNGINNAQIHLVEGNEPKGFQVDYIQNNGWVRFNKVNFDNKLGEFKARVSSGSSGGTLEFRIGSPGGQLLASMPISNTGGWGQWKTKTIASNANVSGIKDLVCVFKGTSQYLFNLNWVSFNGSTLSNTNVIKPNFDIKLSSNPLTINKDYLILTTKNTNTMRFSLVNIEGKVISNKQIENLSVGTNRIEVNSVLPQVIPGVYFLKLSDSASEETIKLIIK